MGSIKIITGVLIIIAIFYLAFFYSSSEQISENTMEYTGLFIGRRLTQYPMIAEVTEPGGNVYGIAAEEKLNFGRIPAGNDIRKMLNLNNDDDPVKIRVFAEGDIAPFILVSNNNFILEGEQEIEITFKSADTGNFSGILNVEATTPMNWLGGWFLQWT